MGTAVVVLALLSALSGCDSARILAAVPFPSISHQLPMRMLALELARRGHDVTFITTNPTKMNVANYTEVDISPAYCFLRKTVDWMEVAMRPWDPVDILWSIERRVSRICEDGLRSPDMVQFIRSSPKFDLYIMELGVVPCFYGVAHAVGNPPLIGFVSHGAHLYTHWVMRNGDSPAYLPSFVLPYSDHMDFWQRLHSTYIWLYQQYWWFWVVLPKHDEIQRNVFGVNSPPIEEVQRNFSLVLACNHFSVNYPRPNLPNMIELTGLHVDPKVGELPKDVLEWLEGADAGVVYFSLGTNVLGSTMPEQKRRAFLDAFRQLPQRVLWKWETDNATDLPPNVKVAKWLPQQAVLAHPKVRAFITQGGIQSFNEACYHGVPLIGIPFLGDQPYNVEKMVAAGIGYRLLFREITVDTVLKALRTVLDDPRYRENMKRLSAVYREHQAESLPKAIWWIEYVLRHNGAPHLRSAAVDLSWYQLLLLDVVAFVLAVAIASGAALFHTTKFIISFTFKAKKVKSQ